MAATNATLTDIPTILEAHAAEDAAAAQAAADKATQDAAVIAGLRKALAECEAKNPPLPTTTTFGVSFPSGTGGKYENRAGVARVFFQGLKGVDFTKDPRVIRARALGITVFVISWKEEDAALVEAFLATIPRDLTIYACFNHEPENDATKIVNGKRVQAMPGDPEYAARSKRYKAVWDEQAPIIRAHDCIPTAILMGYSLYPGSKRDFMDWVPNKGACDVLAFDGYVNKYAPSTLVPAILAACDKAGIKWTGIAETGSQLTDTARPAKMTDLRDRILGTKGRFLFAIYWDAADPGFDCHLDDATANVWLPAKRTAASLRARTQRVHAATLAA